METEVLIIGAGSAGLSLAHLLGKNKKSVIIVERKKQEEIGKKVCGDVIISEKVKRFCDLTSFQPPHGEELAQEINQAVFVLESGTEFMVPFDGVMINRNQFGQRLTKEVLKNESVTLLSETIALDPIIEDETVKGCIVSQNGKQIAINAKVTVDCSGFSAKIRKKVAATFPSLKPELTKYESIISYRYIIKTPVPHPYQNQIRVAVHPLLPSPGYVWIFSKGEYYLNIGIGWLLNPKNEDINIQKRMEKIYHELFPNTEIVEKGGGFLPGRLPYYTLVANGFMCCGDSAAVVDPINGGGHAQAIVSGYYAGETILDAFKQNKFDEQTLWSYNKKVWDDFGIESALGVCVHKFLEKTSFQELSFLIEDKIISQELVQDLILESSTKPPIFSIFFKCLKKPKLLYYTIKTFLLSARIKKHINKYPKSINEFEKWVKKIEKLENKKL